MPRLKPGDKPLTPEEDAAVVAGIESDPEDFELDADWFAGALLPLRFYRPSSVVMDRLNSGGISNSSVHKEGTSHRHHSPARLE